MLVPSQLTYQNENKMQMQKNISTKQTDKIDNTPLHMTVFLRVSIVITTAILGNETNVQNLVTSDEIS